MWYLTLHLEMSKFIVKLIKIENIYNTFNLSQKIEIIIKFNPYFYY